jgi:O-antigen ligase
VYTLVPGFAYALIIVASLVVIANPVFQNSVFDYLPPERIAGVLLFNAFFLIATFGSDLDTRTRFVHLLSLGTFLLSFATTTLSLQGVPEKRESANRILRLAAMAALIVLFCGQLAEVFGYIAPQDPGVGRDELSLWQRPGGFLNANMTAAVSLVLAYSIFELSDQRGNVLDSAALMLFVASLALTQSRAGILFSTIYLAILVFRRQIDYRPVLCALIVTVVVAASYSDEPLLRLFIDNLASRFQGDSSYSERINVFLRALGLFGDAPLFGHGYRYIQGLLSVSTHNEILENAVNFGIVGSIVVWISFFLIYEPRSLSFFVACIAPSLLFSHNFFETVSLQVTLGTACAISSMQSMRKRIESPYASPARAIS